MRINPWMCPVLQVKRVRCESSGVLVPKDKAIKRFIVRNIVDASAIRDLQDSCAVEGENYESGDGTQPGGACNKQTVVPSGGGGRRSSEAAFCLTLAPSSTCKIIGPWSIGPWTLLRNWCPSRRPFAPRSTHHWTCCVFCRIRAAQDLPQGVLLHQVSLLHCTRQAPPSGPWVARCFNCWVRCQANSHPAR